MMVDYSDWLNSLPREFHLNTGWFLVIAIVSVSVMFLILARCRDLTDSLGWENAKHASQASSSPPGQLDCFGCQLQPERSHST